MKCDDFDKCVVSELQSVIILINVKIMNCISVAWNTVSLDWRGSCACFLVSISACVFVSVFALDFKEIHRLRKNRRVLLDCIR